MRFALGLIVWALTTIISSESAVALNERTHLIINEEATRLSEVDRVLKKQLGVVRGIEEPVQGRTILQRVGEGGEREDDGSLLLGTARYLRHFHDPLRSWDQSGLDLLLRRYDSSIRWMQRINQNDQAPGTGNWSWQDARRFYGAALTAEQPADREQAWADTFRALGQATHLVVDASVPEHVREDAHAIRGPLGNYEYWVERQHGIPGSEEERAFIQRYFSAPVGPDPTLLQQPTGDPDVPVPIARLIDTNRYTGTSPNVTLDGPIGIAEFANANFFSEDTGQRRLLSPDYPFPSVESLVPSVLPAPRGDWIRAYYAKGQGDGLPIDPVLAECVFDQAAAAAGITPGTYVKCVDEKVWANTAREMLPRTVGYSAALLDYFFRGRLEGEIDGARLRIRNRTPGEAMSGAFELYYDATGGTRVFLTRWENLTLASDEEHPPLAIPPHLPTKPPSNPNSYWLVFRGQLGDEPDAVVPVRVTRNPAILVYFGHRGLWAGWVSGGQYYAGLWPDLLPEMLYHQAVDPYFGASEQISYSLYSVFVPDDPAAPLIQQEVPWTFLQRVEVTPDPAITGLNLRHVGNYEQRGQDTIVGVSVLEAETSWRLTLVWADWVAAWSGAESFLGRTADGQIDVSPRVVKVCPGHEWAGPFGGTVGPFGPQSLTHPKVYHCPDWLVFGD